MTRYDPTDVTVCRRSSRRPATSKAPDASAASNGPATCRTAALRTHEERFGTLLMQHKLDLGVPVEHSTCHTGSIDGYFLESHVPAADTRPG